MFVFFLSFFLCSIGQVYGNMESSGLLPPPTQHDCCLYGELSFTDGNVTPYYFLLVGYDAHFNSARNLDPLVPTVSMFGFSLAQIP